MTSLERIQAYVNTVCQQIRWKKAHNRVSEELLNHIEDGRDSYITQGLDENTATEKAIAETGDAADIGTQLDRIHRPKPQWGMLAATVVLLLLGLLVRLFVFRDADEVGFISTRLLFTGIGIVGMIAAYFADFTFIGKYPKTIYFGIMFISVAIIFFSPLVNKVLYLNRIFSYGQHVILLFPLAFQQLFMQQEIKVIGVSFYAD